MKKHLNVGVSVIYPRQDLELSDGYCKTLEHVTLTVQESVSLCDGRDHV